MRSLTFLLAGKKPASFFITPSTKASGHDAPLVIKIFSGSFAGN
jgi:hypothetical protein